MAIDRAWPAAVFCGLIAMSVSAQESRDDAERDSLPAPAESPEVNTIPVADTTPDTPVPSASPLSASPLIEEIIVTAQKREESINEVPIAVSAFTGEALQALGVTDTRDLGNLVPGFSVSHSGQNTPVYTLRGVGFNDTAYAATSTVGVYTDEVSLPYSFMTKGANLDLQRVEVLKGPQGTLYGRNTTGGAINYVANKPTDNFAAGVNGSFSRFQTTEVEGFISGALSDTLQGRFALKDLRSQQGWQHSNTRPDDRLGRQDKQAARGTLDWRPQDALLLRLVLSGWRDYGEPQAPQAIAIRPQLTQADGAAGEALLVPEVRDYPVIPPDSEDTQRADWYPGFTYQNRDSFYQAALTTKWSLGESLELTAIAAHGKVASRDSQIPLSGLDSANLDSLYDASVETSNLEVRLSGFNSDETFRWMIGGNASRDSAVEERTAQGTNGTILFPIPGTDVTVIGGRGVFFINGYTDADAGALFVNTEWTFAEHLKLTTGARYTAESRDYTGCTSTEPDNTGFYTVFDELSRSRGGDGVRPGECATMDEQGDNEPYLGRLSEDNISGRVALDWTPLDDVLLYASFSRGFKSGSFPVGAASSKNQLEPVTQEQLHAFELGSKTGLLDRAVQINTALFYYDYKDKQLFTHFLDSTFGPLPILANAPQSTVLGAELEIVSSPLQGLFVSTAASYIDTRVDEFVSTNSDGETQDFSGRPFNFAPLLQYTVLADYTWSLTETWYMAVGADYSFKDKTNSTLGGDPLFAHRAYGLVNARMRFGRSDTKWTMLLFGRNLTDQFSTLSINRGTGDAITRYTGQPRIWGLMLSYNYVD